MTAFYLHLQCAHALIINEYTQTHCGLEAHPYTSSVSCRCRCVAAAAAAAGGGGGAVRAAIAAGIDLNAVAPVPRVEMLEWTPMLRRLPPLCVVQNVCALSVIQYIGPCTHRTIQLYR